MGNAEPLRNTLYLKILRYSYEIFTKNSHHEYSLPRPWALAASLFYFADRLPHDIFVQKYQ